MQQPVLTWRTPGATLTAGTCWLRIDAPGLPSFRLREQADLRAIAGLFSECHELRIDGRVFSVAARVAGKDVAVRFPADMDMAQASLTAGGACYLFPPALFDELRRWTVFISGGHCAGSMVLGDISTTSIRTENGLTTISLDAVSANIDRLVCHAERIDEICRFLLRFACTPSDEDPGCDAVSLNGRDSLQLRRNNTGRFALAAMIDDESYLFDMVSAPSLAALALSLANERSRHEH